MKNILLIIVFILIQISVQYFFEKGKNLATKQDISEITKKVENVKADVMRSSRIEETKYRLKYEACMDALSLIDAFFSQILQNPGSLEPTKQYSTIENARLCHNKLILSCENVEILNLFGEIMFAKPGEKYRKPPTDLLNDFRNLVRHELGFGQSLPLDRECAWFGTVCFEKK